MSGRPVVHPMTSGGWCRVCGELADWLAEHGGVMVADE